MTQDCIRKSPPDLSLGYRRGTPTDQTYSDQDSRYQVGGGWACTAELSSAT